MTGEELNRKYWKLRGARNVYIGQGCCILGKDGRNVSKTPANVPKLYANEYEAWKFGVPALHLDLNLAIAEADSTFYEWRHFKTPSTGNPLANLNYFGDGCVQVMAWPTRSIRLKFERSGEHALCEAILEALIAAKESETACAKDSKCCETNGFHGALPGGCGCHCHEI